MKKLGITKHLLIALTILIAVVSIALLTLIKPKDNFRFNSASTLENLIKDNYFINLDDADNSELVLLDIRSPNEYERGHLENAINLVSSEILNKENQAYLNELQDSNKTVVIYGSTPEEANIPFTILYQLGYDNIKLLPIELSYSQNKLITNQVDVEKQEHDINLFIAESIKKAKAAKQKKVVKPVVKPVILKPKKKKKKPEGGC